MTGGLNHQSPVISTTSAVRSVLTTWVQYGMNIVNKTIMIYVQSGLQIGKQILFQSISTRIRKFVHLSSYPKFISMLHPHIMLSF